MKKIALSGLSVLLILFFVSCGSKPAPAPAPAPEPPKIEEPPAPPAPEKIVEEIKKADNTLALKGIDDARKKALENDADEYAPDELAAIDAIYEKIKAKSDNGEDVSVESLDLANRYAALSAYIDALKAKEIIDDTEMFSLAQSVYDEGEKALEEYEELVEDPNSTGKAQLEKATKASASYNSVLIVIYKKVAKDERTDAFVAKKNADSVKAAVAQKAKYDEGVEYFKKGDSLYSMQSFEKAYESYKSSKEIFNTLYNEIADKRAAVLKAIEEAKRKVEETADFAEQADRQVPLREKIDGIEDEDAVLLEEDEYDDPEDAEVDLPEDIEDPTKKLLKAITGDAK